MILFFVLALLQLPSIVGSTSTLRLHVSDAMRFKCEALPYRTFLENDLCYFAVLREISYSDAQEQCSTILPGAKIAIASPHTSGSTEVEEYVFKGMMVDKSNFHLNKASTGLKHTICVYYSGYICEGGDMYFGRCVFLGTHKGTYSKAENQCADQGYRLPSPANDLDNQIVRAVLEKDPAWVHKVQTKDSEIAGNQAGAYSRWSTCDNAEGSKPTLYTASQKESCSNDTAPVIDRNGYWSNVNRTSEMAVVCIRNAENVFTIEEPVSCDYHAGHNTASRSRHIDRGCNGSQFAMVPVEKSSVNTCYTPTIGTMRYKKHRDSCVVDTKRSCELECDKYKSECIGFSFKQVGTYASCILLEKEYVDFIDKKRRCDKPTTIYLKQTTGCAAVRTNLTAEFGDDPCIDSRHDNALRPLGSKRICTYDKKTPYVIRAIDANGCRITLDNGKWNYIEKVGDMWEYRFGYTNKSNSAVGIVAATCVLAGSEKCPCEPMKFLAKSGKTVISADPKVANSCSKKGAAVQWTDVPKCRGYGTYDFDRRDTTTDNLVCRAGTWMLSRESTQNSWAVTGISCFK